MKNFHKLNIAVVTATTAAVAGVLLFAPRPVTSETERRDLTKFPKFSFSALTSGEYAHQITLFYSDTVPLRESLTFASSRIRNVMGVRTDGVKLHNIVAPTGDNDSETTEPPAQIVKVVTPPEPRPVEVTVTETTEAVSETTTTAWNGVIEETSAHDIEAVADITNNGILVYGNTALMVYGGNKKAGSRYAAAINAYRDALPADVNVFNLVNPTSVEFYCPKDYRRLNGDQRANINHIYGELADGVTPVNAYSALAEHLEEPIYLRTDHHWAPLGAYYAAGEFCATAGVPFADIAEYEQVVVPGYVGTMYGYSGDERIKNNPEDFVYYKPLNTDYSVTYYNYANPSVAIESVLFFKQPIGSSYCVFLGGDEKITRIKTNVGNGRKLAVFKDSFGNALIPFLTGSFDEIIVIDIRYFPYKATDYLIENGVTDVLFSNNIFAANTDSLISYIEKIM